MAIGSEARKDDKFERLFQGFPVAFGGVRPIRPGFPFRTVHSQPSNTLPSVVNRWHNRRITAFSRFL